MKYLKMFEAITGLFPKMIKVTLVDTATKSIIEISKIPAEQLPAAFNRPITLEINNVYWRVLQANPILADDFLFSKKLTLHVQNTAIVDRQQLYFELPTICQNLPTTGIEKLYDDFTVELGDYDWQQIEFKTIQQAPAIEEDISKVNEILVGQDNPLLGYQHQFLREVDAHHFSKLSIPFNAFYQQVNPVRIGNILLGNRGYVKNGFALQSDSYTYYGIVENDLIHSLAVSHFEYVDDEFMQILKTFELLLVDWCNASILSMVSNDKTAEQPLQF